MRLGVFSLVSAASLPFGWGAILFWLGTHLDGNIPVYWFGVPIVICICGSLVGAAIDYRLEQIPASQIPTDPIPADPNAASKKEAQTGGI